MATELKEMIDTGAGNTAAFVPATVTVVLRFNASEYLWNAMVEEVHYGPWVRTHHNRSYAATDSGQVDITYLDDALYSDYLYDHVAGRKRYELSNHLGNVLAVVSDRALPVEASRLVPTSYVPDVLTVNDYYPFGMTMEGRSYSSNKYRYGFNGMEKDDELKGSGNSYDFGARIYDSRVARWLSLDPLAHKAPYENPYLFAGGNPIVYVVPDGQFKLHYTDEVLERNGLTQLDVARFEAIVNNIINLVEGNDQALDAMSNATGFSREQILSDFQSGSGPVVQILETGGGARGSESGIVVDPAIIKALSSIDGADKETLSNQVLGTALLLIHEYGHYGDQVTNNGKNSGQYSIVDGKLVFDVDYGFDPDAIKLGSQKWKISITGHRGSDIELIGFGVQITLIEAGQISIDKKSSLPGHIESGSITVPSQLPSNAQGTNILNTLEVD